MISEKTDSYFNYRKWWPKILDSDLSVLRVKDKEYGGSWKKRGGANAFFMLCRKWDRLEEQLSNNEPRYDIIEQAVLDKRPEGILDDIADLRRYLLNVEAEIRARMELEDKSAPPTKT